LIVEHLHLPSALSLGLSDFPDAFCINMLREPRAGFYSLHHATLRWFDHAKTRGLHGFAERCWLAGWQLFAEGHPLLPADRLRHLRLEDLHRDGENVMREVAEWLGITAHASLLQSTLDGRPWSGTTPAGEPASGLSPARAAELAHGPIAAARIEWVLGQLVERAGYRRQAPDGAAGAVLGLLAQLVPLERELWVPPLRAWRTSCFDDAVENPLVEWLEVAIARQPALRALWSALGLERRGAARRAALRAVLIAALTACRVGVDPWLFYLKRTMLFARGRRRLRNSAQGEERAA
jgi:hypothetical protein